MGKPTKKSQSEKFKDLAREIDADEDKDAFEGKLRTIARQKAPKDNPKDEK
ncbi:MAG: hypothetical protein ABJ215_00420 [Alphaproteobacteria bacterium]